MIPAVGRGRVRAALVRHSDYGAFKLPNEYRMLRSRQQTGPGGRMAAQVRVDGGAGMSGNAARRLAADRSVFWEVRFAEAQAGPDSGI